MLDKNKPTKQRVIYRDKEIRGQIGMQYWYWYGDRQFDIRPLREVCGVNAESKLDKWFMGKKPNYCNAFLAITDDLIRHIRNRDLDKLIDLSEEWDDQKQKIHNRAIELYPVEEEFEVLPF